MNKNQLEVRKIRGHEENQATGGPRVRKWVNSEFSQGNSEKNREEESEYEGVPFDGAQRSNVAFSVKAVHNLQISSAASRLKSPW